MKLHLLLESLDGERASLRSEAAEIFQVPAVWLPSTAIEGTPLIIEVTAGDARVELSIRIAKGVTEPHGTDVGG